jgi:hypothetical protein
VGELERDVAAADEQHAPGHSRQVEERVAEAHSLGAGERQGHGHRARRDEHAAASQPVVAHGHRRRSHEAGDAVEELDAHLRPRPLRALGRLADQRLLEGDELRPVERELARRHPVAAQVTGGVDRLGGTDQDLLGHAAAQGAGAPERLPVHDGHTPAGLTAAGGDCRGDAAADHDEIVLSVHGAPSVSSAGPAGYRPSAFST